MANPGQSASSSGVPNVWPATCGNRMLGFLAVFVVAGGARLPTLDRMPRVRAK